MGIFFRYIALLAIFFAVGCSNSNEGSGGSAEEGSFVMSLDMTRAATSSVGEEIDEEMLETLLENSTLKIYNSSEGLVRYYSPAPSTITDYMAVGDYSMELKIGEGVYATFSQEETSYYGTSEFTIDSQETAEVQIEAYMLNSVMSVDFDSKNGTLNDHYDSYSVVAYLANSLEEVDSKTESLSFSTSKDGWIICPEGVESIVWQFTGDGEVVFEGVIENIEVAHQYKLSFQYTDYLYVNSLVLEFEDIEGSNDAFDFKVQPVIHAVDFDEDTLQDYTVKSSFDYTITSVSAISTINVSVEESGYNNTFAATDYSDGSITYDSQNQTLTIEEGLFSQISSGDLYQVNIAVTSENNAVGVASLEVGLSGFLGLESEDFWTQTTSMLWLTATPASEVKIRYRYDSDSDWRDEISMISSDGGYIWSATNGVEWIDSTNGAGFAVSQIDYGHKPSQGYKYQAVVDGVESDIATATSADATLEIEDGDLNDSELSCFTTGNSYAPFWASGNNTTTSSLCTFYDDYANSGVQCAYLKGVKETVVVYTVFAAGNLYSGVFAMTSSTEGTASFGQKYDWTVRPTALNLKYKSVVGSDDKNLVYVAIVDWTSRHGVVAGTGDTEGIWNPSTQKSTDEGDIIGYGIVYLSESQSTFTDLNIPIYYYDKSKKPSSDNYSIVINCTSSYDGDNKNGSTDSAMWVDDFKFEY